MTGKFPGKAAVSLWLHGDGFRAVKRAVDEGMDDSAIHLEMWRIWLLRLTPDEAGYISGIELFAARAAQM